MVLKRSYLVILVITTVSSVHLSSAFNFHHDEDEFGLRGPKAERSYGPLFRNDVEMEAEPDLGDLEEVDSEHDDSDHKFEIKLKLGNGVTVGCEVEKRSNYEDVTDMYLEDEFGRRSPEMSLDPPQAMFRAAPSLFTRHPEATADLLEMEVPYGWWPAECIQRIMGLSFENTLCNCPAGPTGIAGRPGPEGPPGPTGPPGLDGTNSTDGLPGPIGDAGPPGPPGLRGNPGAPGIPGSAGDAGPVGPPGNPGRDGRPGPPGAPGSPGQDGKAGKNGRNGRNGRDGLQGPPGAAGIPGNQGLQGLPGEQGENGIPAPTGVNGINGQNGEAGLPGRPGDNGPCGAASSSSGWSSTTPAEEGNGWTNDEITIEYTPDENVESPPEEETQEEIAPPNQGGWSADHEEELGATTAWGGEIIAEPEPLVHQPNPAITPAKPAQPAQSSLPMKPYQAKPVMGSNPFIPQPGFVPPRPQQGPAQAVGPSSSLGHHDKRPDYPVSQSFQGPNQLWSTPQFQSSIPMMQSYGQMGGIGNSQWKNSGIRTSGPKSKGAPCKKKGRGKSKSKPARPQNDNSAKAETIRNVAHEVFNKPEANKAAVAPPRARVDLDLLQDTEDRSLH